MTLHTFKRQLSSYRICFTSDELTNRNDINYCPTLFSLTYLLICQVYDRKVNAVLHGRMAFFTHTMHVMLFDRSVVREYNVKCNVVTVNMANQSNSHQALSFNVWPLLQLQVMASS